MIDSIEPGEMKIGGKNYTFDVWIFGDGRVMQRDATLSSDNKVSVAEVQVILDNSLDMIALILGTGQKTSIEMSPEAKELLEKKKKIAVWDYPTDDAVKVFNDQLQKGQKIAAIMHLN
jgi:hypothetical protein